MDQDWDAFRVDAGWCCRVSFDIPGPINDDETYDRRGKSALYVKVGDEANAHIVRQSSSSCRPGLAARSGRQPRPKSFVLTKRRFVFDGPSFVPCRIQ
ncbi:hypothetical protein SAMN06272781_8089 [Streptomyces sp. 1222.2]|nr:hypothetical protein SAMN06272781_8089 [Streptomyces sp. 1222.2]